MENCFQLMMGIPWNTIETPELVRRGFGDAKAPKVGPARFYTHVAIHIDTIVECVYIYIFILIGGLEHVLFSHILGTIIPID